MIIKHTDTRECQNNEQLLGDFDIFDGFRRKVVNATKYYLLLVWLWSTSVAQVQAMASAHRRCIPKSMPTMSDMNETTDVDRYLNEKS